MGKAVQIIACMVEIWSFMRQDAHGLGRLRDKMPARQWANLFGLMVD